jgi:hypothetical protein
MRDATTGAATAAITKAIAFINPIAICTQWSFVIYLLFQNRATTRNL